jgi:hypothetical protein
MKQSNRRIFMMQVAVGGTALLAQQAMAQAMVNEKDPQAAALGYAADTTKVDAKNSPNMRPLKSAPTALCSPENPPTLPVHAPCSQASKSLATVGARLTPRKHNRLRLSAAPKKLRRSVVRSFCALCTKRVITLAL